MASESANVVGLTAGALYSDCTFYRVGQIPYANSPTLCFVQHTDSSAYKLSKVIAVSDKISQMQRQGHRL